LLTVLVLGALGAVGYGVYQIGFEQGLAQSGAEVIVNPPGTVVYPGLHPGIWGFGFVGIFFKILFFVLIFGLIARIFFGRRRWGWGPGPYRGRPGWHHDHSPMEDHLGEWHRQAHEGHADEDPADGPRSG
jgi:hypothetical protein